MAHRVLNRDRGILLVLLAAAMLLASAGPASAQRRVERVAFHGNEAFPSDRLEDVTRVEDRGLLGWGVLGWLGWGRPRFNYLVMGRDVTLLRAFYRNRGYLQCSVSDRAEPLGEARLVVHYTIEEGPRYTLEELRFSGNTVFGDERLRGMLEGMREHRLREGVPISEEALQTGSQQLRQAYREEGYHFARISPRIGERDSTSGAAPVTFRIQEGQQVHVDRVIVEGARQTKDFVITREVTLDPGDLLQESERMESQRRLYNTGIFRTANVTIGEVSPDSTRVNVLVTVREQPRRYFGVGTGIAGDDQEQLDLNLHGSVEWGHRNLFGTGRALELQGGADFRVITAWELVRRELSLRYVEPWFWGTRTPLTVTFALRPQSYGIYDVQEFATEVGLNREFTPRSRGWLNLTYRLVDTEVPIEAFSSRDALRGVTVRGERDTRNNVFSPLTGSFSQFYLRAYGGPLGGPSYSVLNTSWSRYQLTGSRTIMASRIRLGIAQPYSGQDEVLIFDRFFAGGANSVRGYEERRLGPVAAATDTTTGQIRYEPRGGRILLLANLELRRARWLGPLGLKLFLDAGNVWARFGDVSPRMALSAGVGVYLDTPVGPFRLDYGWRLNKSPVERDIPGYSLPPGQLHLSVLHAF